MSRGGSYAHLAACYDALMDDGQYRERAAFLDRTFRKRAEPVETVLDLACGTGTVSCLLSRRGYRVIATDQSEEMLTAAAAKAADLGGRYTPPQFVRQSMPELDLGGGIVDAAVSTLDSINYLTRRRDLKETFRRVFRALRPGGLFLFDVNTPYKLRRMNGQTYYDEKPGLFCVWRTFFRERGGGICLWQVDLFRRESDGRWTRYEEEHRERAWTEAQLRRYLGDAGFRPITVAGDLSWKAPAPDEDRWTVLAEKPRRGT